MLKVIAKFLDKTFGKYWHIVLKIILTPVYPIWYFLSKTYIGEVLVLVAPLFGIANLIFYLAPHLHDVKGEEAEALGGGLAIFIFLAYPIVWFFLVSIGTFLEVYYEAIGYPTESILKIG